jgi:hypothetical protein
MITLTSSGVDRGLGESNGPRPLSAATERSASDAGVASLTEGGRLASRLAPRDRLRRLGLKIHRALLRTERGRLRPLWTWAYFAAVHACSAYLRAGERRATIYVGGSLGGAGPVYGLSDLDLAAVLPDPQRPGTASTRVRGRWDRLTRAVPFMVNLVDCCVYEEAQLRDAVAESTITYGLEHSGRDAAAGPAVYHGPFTDEDKMRLLERPELYGPTSAWRRVAGAERRPPDPGRDPQRRRIAAWLELQFLWRLAVELCLNPDRPGAASMCVKLVAEPARIWLWLDGGRQTGTREQTLREAIGRMLDERATLERALSLQRALASSPEPPLAESLGAFVRLSARIAEKIGADLDGAGTTEVSLTGGEDPELALPHGGWDPTAPSPESEMPPLLPLVDWRTIVYPTIPDETFAPIAGDPGDPSQLARAALIVDKGPYPTLSAPGLLIRPFHGGRARLRAVQCEVTDPVSFAVAKGLATARFPNVLGWSARDTASRGIAEYAAWLSQHRVRAQPSGEHLGTLIAAARAALFLEGIREGNPELPLTAAATMKTLGDRLAGVRSVAESAWEAYRAFAVDWGRPPPVTVAALDEVVRALPGYARSDA